MTEQLGGSLFLILITPIYDFKYNIKLEKMNSQQRKSDSFKVSPKRRKELIRGVLQRGKPIAYIAKKLRIRYAIARTIVNDYKEKMPLDENTNLLSRVPVLSEVKEEGSQEIISSPLGEREQQNEQVQPLGFFNMMTNVFVEQFPENVVFFYYPWSAVGFLP